MRDRHKLKDAPKKDYQKPAWQKEEMLARFALGCCKTPQDHGCTNLRNAQYS
jgi:hypothetical protein